MADRHIVVYYRPMVKRVTPPEAEALLAEGWTYLDVRSIPEFEGGHPAGAANMPLLHMQGGRMAPNPDFQAVVAANYPEGHQAGASAARPADARCRPRRCWRPPATRTSSTCAAASTASATTFGRVSCAGWAEAGLPVETAAAPERSLRTSSPRSAG